MKKNKVWQILSFCFLSAFLFFSLVTTINHIQAQTNNNKEQSDAIGIRIIPNPNHYSISRWYQSQGYSGSPQALTVDGYEALRDGRTVYINAAHILPSEKNIYTNIYLISYNQDQSSKTVDILGQIISHWKFNDNLPAEESTCSISAVKCESDTDCPVNQDCDLSSGTCQLTKTKACKVDDDCPVNFFCNSVKAKIIRDLSRIGKIEELREVLSSYRDNNGHYPLLSAGTYLPGVSTSLWPSWQESFLSSLNTTENFLDPINRFGVCLGYDKTTCWDKNTQKFVSDKQGLNLVLPNDSYALVYTTNDSGSEYNLCAVMESRDSSDPRLGYSLTPNDPPGSNCVVSTGIGATGGVFNTAPKITDLALSGISGKEYNGFIRAIDSENDPLFWSINTSSSDWLNWSQAPIIKGTNDNYQKKIFAQRAGDSGDYPITITVTDSKGASTATTTTINIRKASTLSQASEYVYRLDPEVPFNYSYYVSGSTSVPEIDLVLKAGPHILGMPEIERISSADGMNRLKITHKGVFSTSREFKEDSETLYELVIDSGTDEGSANDFIIKIKVDKPILNFNCDTQVRVGHDYSCRLGSTKQGNHTISYSNETPLPPGLEIIEIGEEGEIKEVYLQGRVNKVITGQEIGIKATNEYNTENTKSFVLRVNSYCGDGIKQTPNTEGRGGMYNNGYEACDGDDLVTSDPEKSNKTRQYACNTSIGENTPYPITTYSQCVFKSPLDGGGYCGDTYCQDDYENKENCPFDCNPNYNGPPPNFAGSEEDYVECGPELPECPDGLTCISGRCQVAQCWEVEKMTKIQFKEGDATLANVTYYYVDTSGWFNKTKYYNFNINEINETDSVNACVPDSYLSNCTYVKIDNPVCVDNSRYKEYEGNIPTTNNISCPLGYGNLTMIGRTTGGDTCRDKNDIINYCEDRWCGRYIYECSKVEMVTRCVGDPCRTEDSYFEDGILNSEGVCIKKSDEDYLDIPNKPDKN